MEVQQQDDHRRNFAITKSRLQHMKHDPSVSIDDFISKMFVSKDSPAAKSPFSPKLSQGSSVLKAQHFSFNPSVSSSGLESDSAPDDAWDNFKSSLDANLFTQPKISTGDSAFNFNAEFDDFISCEPVNHSSTPNLSLAPVFDFSSQSSFNPPIGTAAPHNIPTSPHRKESLDQSGSFDEFSDFVSSVPPSTSSIAKQPPPTPHIIEAAENANSLITPISPKEQPVPESTLQTTDAEDGFEDFQACAFKSLPTIEQIQKQLPIEEWLKCLSECRSMLSESASILSSLVTDSDVDAFLATPRGNEFILELIEIYGIIQRIRLAASLNDLRDPQLQAVFNQIDRVWGDLARFVKNQDHKLILKRRLVQSVEAATTVDPLSVEPNCGVCVTPVPASSSSSAVEVEPGTAVISLAGRVYHASCANLWVNRIELSLPSLRVR